MFDYLKSLAEFTAHFDLPLSEVPEQVPNGGELKKQPIESDLKKGGAIKKGGTNARLSKKNE